MADELTHVLFPLEVNEGWPPVSEERVWAQQVGPDLFRLDNAPWFALGVSAGDVVRAVAGDRETWPVFDEIVEWSGNYTLRVVPFRSGPLAGSQQAVLDAFLPLGVTGEGAGTFPIVALTVTPQADLTAVKKLLREGVADGRWDFEEGCVDDRWSAL